MSNNKGKIEKIEKLYNAISKLEDEKASLNDIGLQKLTKAGEGIWQGAVYTQHIDLYLYTDAEVKNIMSSIDDAIATCQLKINSLNASMVGKTYANYDARTIYGGY